MAQIHRLFPGAGAPPDPAKDKLISEAEVLVFRPALCVSLLRAARKLKLIAYTRGRRQSVWYTLADVDAYLETRKNICHVHGPDPSLNSGGIGSQKNPAAPASTITGMTPELEELAGRAAAREILGKRSSS